MAKQRKKWEMDRRTFLRGTAQGAGFLLGLPLLEAMMPSIARAQSTYPDANFIALFKPLGIDRRNFFPTQYTPVNTNTSSIIGTFTGNSWNLDGISSKPLLPHKDVISIFAGAGYSIRGNDHEEEAMRFLTGLSPLGPEGEYADVRLNRGAVLGQGKSMDQYIAEYLFQAANPLRPTMKSLQLAVDLSPFAPNHNNISYENWKTPMSPMASNDLGKIFDMLFCNTTTGTPAPLSEKNQRKSNILDSIWNEGTKSLLLKLGTSDKITMQSFFNTIESVKKKIDGTASCTVCPTQPARRTTRTIDNVTPGAIVSADLDLHYDIITDLMVIALQCNRTRVISLMMGPSMGPHQQSRNWTNLNGAVDALTQIEINNQMTTITTAQKNAIKAHLTGTDMHQISHLCPYDDPIGRMTNAIIDQYYIKQLALLITKLKAANLIDKTLVLFGAGFGNPFYHSSNGVPCITAGKALGAKTNMLRVFQQYLEFDDTPINPYNAAMSRLMVDIMQRFSNTLQVGKTFDAQGNPTSYEPLSINNFGLRQGESTGTAARTANFGLF